MTTNLFDYFEEVRDAATGAPWAARAPRKPNERFDVKLVPRAPQWHSDPASLQALERLEEEPWVDALTRREGDVELRLADSWIESTGAALEAGGGDEVELADLARGRRYAIQFWDANATKALHVGHLRNLALGNSLAAALEQAGGEVQRRSVISDAGRSMGEAMAGIVQSGHHTSAWPEGDQKSDHFVGLCYADYVASGGSAFETIDEREDSLTRELRMRNDAADELLKRVMAGESDALELWFKTRAWVISGQRKTLSRLGVAFDRVFFESDFLEDGAALTEQGLRQGTLTRREDGVISYATGVQEMEEMPLVRADGQTTQHMRAVSYWMGTPDVQGVTTIQITGTEWVAHSTCIRLLMSELTPSENGGSSRGIHPTLDVFHGMVAQQKRAVSSSDEGGLLIDDLIEWIESRIEADEAMREVRRAHPAPERIPAQIALGYFLPYPMTPRVDFETDKLLTERESLGWDLVRARARRGEHPKGHAPRGAGRLDTSPGHRPAEDPDYRSAVVQSEIYRRHLRLAVERYDVTPLALYLRHLARWYMESERSSHVERVIHTLLDRSARGLGLGSGALMSTLLIDNYDSYTYNVFHLLAAASGEEPIVVHNDVISWRALSRWDFDAIVLSPGPGRPDRWHDFGVCTDILRFSEAPVLGVCLGHQGLGHVLKATVTTAPAIMHGRLSAVKHTGEGLFAGIPQDFSVVRYHSLAVTGSLGEEGREIAWTADGVVMGIEHAQRPLWGVQFHPESICTEHGHRLFENFYALAQQRRPASKGRLKRPSVPPRRVQRRGAGEPTARLHVSEHAGQADAELLFERLFGEQRHAFWLDSAERPTLLGQRSYLGASLGAHRLVLEYDVDSGVLTSHDAHGAHTAQETIFKALQREIGARAAVPAPPERPGADSPDSPASGLAGGFVGYLGYECKADCGSANVHSSDVPDAVQLFANRMIAVDHAAEKTYCIAVSLDEDDARDAQAWLLQADAEVEQALDLPVRELDLAGNAQEPVVFRVGRGREQYLADILRCQSALSAGESYEVCLTDQIHTDAAPDPWRLYRGLRRSNPAPFAAYLKLGDVYVLSSSPERFLSVDRRRKVMARPIKGTAPRAADPVRDAATRDELARDEKTFAEHLMIVDLLRNDLGRVCEVDTVRVPELMKIEQYATVHQMISNVEGTLEAGRSAIDCVRACFPGGSMTGAPKLRTMEIIDDIEREARGVYSGAIGWFGLDGCCDLSIVIRTIVIKSGPPARTTIGAGGAIVMQSDPEEEFEEILLKARAPMAAIARAVSESDPPRGVPGAFTVELEPHAAAAAAGEPGLVGTAP